MKVIFHFNCVICGAHPRERNIKDFEWPPSSERLERLLSVVKGIFSYMKDVKWWESDFIESLKKLHDLIPVVAATGLNTFQGSLTLFTVECPLCGTAPGPRPFDHYFRAWFAPDGVQIANLLYEMWYLLRKVPEAAYLVTVFDTAMVKFGMQRCSKCGRPTTALDDGRCRWCSDEERKDKIPNFSIVAEAEEEYVVFLQSLEGHDLLGAGNDGWEAVRTALIQDKIFSGHRGTSYLLMALACHPVSIWLEPWRSILDCEHCAPCEWRDALLLNPPRVPPDLDKLWEKCHDLPVEANEALHAMHALRWYVFPDLADYLESRGLIVRGSPDDFSGFLEHLTVSRIREISNQLGTGKGRSKADIISKVLTNATQEQLSIILPEINEPWIKEFRKPFDGLPEEWLEYTARVATLIEAFVREKFMAWKTIQYVQENKLNFVVEIDWECPSYCRLPEHRLENAVNISIKDVPPWFPGCGCLLTYNSILGDEIKTKLELSITKGMTVKILEYNDSNARIELLNLYGSISKSADGRYCLMYSEGWWLLIENDIIKVMGHMAQPNCGAVANNGTFILTDNKSRRYIWYWYPKDNYGVSIRNRFKGGIFWVIGKSGQPLIRRTCTANIGSACISPEGGYAACSLELDDSNTADSETIVLFDLNLCKQISQFNPAGLHVNRIEIDENERVIKVTNYCEKTFRFNFNGELFDIDALQKENIENANGYYLITLVKHEMEHELTKKEEIKCLELLDKALKKGVSTYTQGEAYAMMGQINEKTERFDEAVKLYETALQLNPKLSIKRHLKQLKDRLQIIETKKDA
ncbi:MAG: hypothetical protein BWX92_02490 [Deltaproteobacteria bacterium ADurb.Bin135]|nr:MAG: hypothetical protein BWX92_02490 [Deltaproteobacteria bacterium ADurb.Bin135]